LVQMYGRNSNVLSLTRTTVESLTMHTLTHQRMKRIGVTRPECGQYPNFLKLLKNLFRDLTFVLISPAMVSDVSTRGSAEFLGDETSGTRDLTRA